MGAGSNAYIELARKDKQDLQAAAHRRRDSITTLASPPPPEIKQKAAKLAELTVREAFPRKEQGPKFMTLVERAVRQEHFARSRPSVPTAPLAIDAADAALKSKANVPNLHHVSITMSPLEERLAQQRASSNKTAMAELETQRKQTVQRSLMNSPSQVLK